jgi:hypothetical protein
LGFGEVELVSDFFPWVFDHGEVVLEGLEDFFVGFVKGGVFTHGYPSIKACAGSCEVPVDVAIYEECSY